MSYGEAEDGGELWRPMAGPRSAMAVEGKMSSCDEEEDAVVEIGIDVVAVELLMTARVTAPVRLTKRYGSVAGCDHGVTTCIVLLSTARISTTLAPFSQQALMRCKTPEEIPRSLQAGTRQLEFGALDATDTYSQCGGLRPHSSIYPHSSKNLREAVIGRNSATLLQGGCAQPILVRLFKSRLAYTEYEGRAADAHSRHTRREALSKKTSARLGVRSSRSSKSEETARSEHQWLAGSAPAGHERRHCAQEQGIAGRRGWLSSGISSLESSQRSDI
nr:hypothetical protein Iba_chr13fCG4140 [Ipomoea batatas]